MWNYGSSSNAVGHFAAGVASTAINISSFGIYDAPYPGGNPVSAPVAGTTLYRPRHGERSVWQL